eukprot:g1231.t1
MIGCTRCGKFVKMNNSGLEWHIKNVHKISDHSKAYNAVTSAKHAVVQFHSVSSAVASKSGNSVTSRNSQTDMIVAQKNPETLREMIHVGKVKPLGHAGLEACRGGDLPLLQELVLSNKYDPSQVRDRNGSNGLLWAAGGGHLDCVQYLIEMCNINPSTEKQSGRRGYAGRTALHWSCRNGHIKVVQYLLASPTSSYTSSLSCKVPMHVDIETDDGTTPFHLAVWQNQIEVCKYLISRGCNVNHVNSYGCNAVLWAGQGLSSGHELFALLHSQKCNFHVFNENTQGILHKAAQRGNFKVCRLLLVGIAMDSNVNDIIKDYRNGLLYLSYQHLQLQTPNVRARHCGDDIHDMKFIRGVLLESHFQLTKSEKSRPQDLAKFSGDVLLESWLLHIYNDLLKFCTAEHVQTSV